MATWAVAGLAPLAWAALVVGTIALLAPLPAVGRLAGLFLTGVACFWRPVPVAQGAVRLTVLDVGQGLAVVLETRRHVLVYDAGPSFRTGSDTGQLVLAPYLRHRGVRSIDRLVVTHDDDDHKGGAASLMELLPTRTLITGPSIASHALAAPPGIVRQTCRRGDTWEWDGVDFEWLHPGTSPHGRDNDSSCVLQVRAGERSALLTGDIEATAETELVSADRLGPVDLVRRSAPWQPHVVDGGIRRRHAARVGRVCGGLPQPVAFSGAAGGRALAPGGRAGGHHRDQWCRDLRAATGGGAGCAEAIPPGTTTALARSLNHARRRG